jgi:hypothetical protein
VGQTPQSRVSFPPIDEFSFATDSIREAAFAFWQAGLQVQDLLL